MPIIAYGQTDPGLRKQNNEDSFLIDDDLGLYLLADGVSQSSAGDVASYGACQIVWKIFSDNRASIEAFKKKPTSELRDRLVSLLKEAIRQANREIYAKGEQQPEFRGMSCTFVAQLIVGDLAIIAHVGDSRMYLLRDGRLHQLTKDHSVIAEQFEKGIITQEEATTSKFQSILTKALGWQPDTGMDIAFFEVTPGDTYLLCSDGLSDYFKANEFAVLAEKIPLIDLPAALVKMANARGGKDNITALVTHVQGAPKEGYVDAAKKMTALKSVPMFKEMSFMELVAVMNIAKIKIVKGGSIAVKPERDAGSLFILVMGQAAIVKDRQKVMQLTPGMYVGEFCIFDNEKKPPCVMAEQPTAFLMLNRDSLVELMQNNPQLAAKFLWTVSQHMYERLGKAEAQGGGQVLNLTDLQMEHKQVASLIRDTMTSSQVIDKKNADQELKKYGDLPPLVE